MLALFVAAPVLLWQLPGVFDGGGLFLFLAVMALVCGLAIWFDPTFERSKLWDVKPVAPAMGWVIGRWVVAAAALTALLGLFAGRELPGLSIAIPTTPFRLFQRQLLANDFIESVALAITLQGQPEALARFVALALRHVHLVLPLIITLFYPWISVYPQNVIYRAFFCHRYRAILGGGWSLILLNAAAFSFGHVMFNNWVVLLLTFVGGLVFTRTYLKSRSLLLASIEHALYGLFCFYLGIGVFLVYGASG